jgi:hypothetical protein
MIRDMVDYTFKKMKLSDAERLWLTEIMKANFSPVNVKSMKIRLRDKLPMDFDPKMMSPSLIQNNRLTLIGLWHVNPNSPIFSQVSKTIEAIKDLILKNHEIKEVTAKEISDLVGISEREAEISLMLIFDFHFFGSASGSGDHCGHRESAFRNDDTAYDEFLRFTNLEQKMEEFFVGPSVSQNIPKSLLSKEETIATSETTWKQPSNREIWSDIYKDFEVKKLTFAKNINFVSDSYKRKAIFRDIEQAYILAKMGFSKPAVILAGSVIEELLRLYLKFKNIKTISNTFDGYIKTCEQHSLLKRGNKSIIRFCSSFQKSRSYEGRDDR